MSDKEATGVIGCVLVIATFLLSPVLYILDGIVLRQLWLWFVVPLFEVPALSIPQAIGLGVIVGYLTHQDRYTKREGDEMLTALIYGILSGIMTPLIGLLIGWIVTLFM
jgi:hypothetical protein